MKRAYTDIPEGQVHYRIEGSGDVILLLHAGVTSSDEYSRVIPFLSKKYCAIAMDYLGNGDSDPAPYPYKLADHARTVVSFMDSLGIKKAVLVGQHFGGKVALEVAVTRPERVNGLVLSSIGYPEAEQVDIGVDAQHFTDQLEIKADGSHVMEWWRRSAMWGHPLNIVEERFLEYVKAGARGGGWRPQTEIAAGEMPDAGTFCHERPDERRGANYPPADPGQQAEHHQKRSNRP